MEGFPGKFKMLCFQTLCYTPWWLSGKDCLPVQETQTRSLVGESLLEKEMATYFGVLGWKTPRTEEPGGLQSTGSQRVRHDTAAAGKTAFKALASLVQAR